MTFATGGPFAFKPNWVTKNYRTRRSGLTPPESLSANWFGRKPTRPEIGRGCAFVH